MELEKKMKAIASKVQTSNPASNKSTPMPISNHGIATLVVMIAVLVIIVLFCCFSAPGIRGLCKKYIFKTCQYDDPEMDNASAPVPQTTASTMILLPDGVALEVDRDLFGLLRTDQSGIDLLELASNLIRFQQANGNASFILDKPPAYEDIFGLKEVGLPPLYGELGSTR